MSLLTSDLVIDIVLHFIFPVSDSGKITERISTGFKKFKIIYKNLFITQTPPLSFAK